MNLLTSRFILLAVLFILAACGSEGAPGNGSTVYMQASIKPGTTGAALATAGAFTNVSSHLAFSNLSSASSASNLMSFQVQSLIYPNVNKIPASPIDVSGLSFTYIPLANSRGKLSPAFSPTVSNFAYSGSLSAGGTLTIDNVPIFWRSDVVSIMRSSTFKNFSSGEQMPYRVAVTFHANEVNTGIQLSNTINVMGIVQVQ